MARPFVDAGDPSAGFVLADMGALDVTALGQLAQHAPDGRDRCVGEECEHGFRDADALFARFADKREDDELVSR